MVAPTSNRRLGQGAALGLPLQAQEGEGHDTLHHPPQDQWLHEKCYSTWHLPDNPSDSCCMVAITHDR
jgi:hypothetical protein